MTWSKQILTAKRQSLQLNTQRNSTETKSNLVKDKNRSAQQRRTVADPRAWYKQRESLTRKEVY